MSTSEIGAWGHLKGLPRTPDGPQKPWYIKEVIEGPKSLDGSRSRQTRWVLKDPPRSRM